MYQLQMYQFSRAIAPDIARIDGDRTIEADLEAQVWQTGPFSLYLARRPKERQSCANVA